MEFEVIEDHSSEYPEPITFTSGTVLTIGERYEGTEDWCDWYLCSVPGQSDGWVPAQVFAVGDDGIARAIEDYSARELNVRRGEVLQGTRHLGGWVWCTRATESDWGWVPLARVRSLPCIP